MLGRSVFGWDYPPGTEFDPHAPWNQTDDDHDPEDDGGDVGYEEMRDREEGW